MEKNELIARLREISSLFCKARDIKQEMDDFEPQDLYERRVAVPPFPDGLSEAWIDIVDYDEVTTEREAVEIMAAAYDKEFEPRKPRKKNAGDRPGKQTKLYDAQKSNRGCLFWVALFFGPATVYFLLSGEGDGQLAANLIYLAIIAACAFAIVSYFVKLSVAKAKDAANTRKAIADYERLVEELEKDYKRKTDEYKAQAVVYERKKAKFLTEYAAWRKVYVAHLAEEEEIAERLEADRVAAVEEIAAKQYRPTLEELAARNDLVAAEYLPVLDVIIELLQSGRADELKEAINLYEEIVYRERQLQLQREGEEQRRHEEELRRRDAERRHQEQMRQRDEQERQRRYDEDRRHREDMRFREEQERQRRREAEARLEQERRIERELRNRR